MNVQLYHLWIKVHIQRLWVDWVWGEVLVKVLVVEWLVMRVQVSIWRSFLQQQVVRGFARTCWQHWWSFWIWVESLCVGVLAGWRWGNGRVLCIRPLWVVLRVCVVSLVWQLAPELSQRCTPASFIIFLRVRSHLIVCRDNTRLLFQYTENQTLPLGKQARPRQLRAVQSDPVSVRALEHRGRTWMDISSQEGQEKPILNLLWLQYAKCRKLSRKQNDVCYHWNHFNFI